MAFAPLHTHSHYSLLRALPKIHDLVAKAKEAGCTALALTDMDNMYGAIDFYAACKDAGIKPIIGLDMSLEGGARIVLLAENFEGYRNLMALVTKTHAEVAEGVPASRELLKEHSNGVLALAPAKHAAHLASYKDCFAEGSYFDDVPLWEVFYLTEEDRRAWDTVQAVANRHSRDEQRGIDEEDDTFAFPSEAQMEARFGTDGLAKTLAIAERCNLELTLGKFVFPEFPLPEGVTADELLRKLCMEGMQRRGLTDNKEATERLEYELGIIKFKGYAAYFLVVEDLIRFARERNIYTNIRGSVAGSLTTYVLRITKIDPLEYKIPFERFLNPERPSAPDIDMDFADNRRDEVIDYTREKYGEDHVAQIGTFGTMLARGVVRDVARALGLPYGLGDAIAKEIPMGSQGFPMTLERALKDNPEFEKMYKKDAQVREIVDLGKIIEGNARHISVHAAGVVISPRPLIEYTPLQVDPKGGKVITQYDMYSVGEDGVGLTKFDFLGIRNLTILENAVTLVEKIRGEKIDIETIPLDDKKTFDMLARGDTEATFQLNGSGMTRFLKELVPSTIHDINAMVALYRPGPMQFIPNYIERKHNPKLISYMDPAMEPILKQTFGILVYQDDLLIMANQLAGYSWGEVDKFRKAVGKKIPEEMARQKEKFIEGCIAHSGWDRKKAQRVWEWIEPFAAYGFNKAHSASYGRVAYQTAYMKANYPVEYMTAVLTAEAGNIDTVSVMVAECKRMHIDVLPPDVNESFSDFAAYPTPDKETPGAIRFGLRSIKNFGEGVAATIIKERKENGRFASLSDFLRRVKDKNLNKKSLESLIMCGALDSLAPLGGRGRMLAHLERLLDYHKEHSEANNNQDSLFSLMSDSGVADVNLPPGEDALPKQKLAWEKELLGLYVSGHPLDAHKDKLASRSMNIVQLKEALKPGMACVVMGLVEDLRPILTKGGDQMAFVKIADDSGSLEAVVFPKLYAKEKTIVTADNVIALKGRLNSRNGELSMVVEAVKQL
jgi:DNA polymerase III subunit alpha